MKDVVIAEGKTSTEAIEKGLKELNCKKEDVEIKILENEEKRSFFSILEPRVVKVELTLKKEKEQKEKKTKELKNENIKPEDIEKCKIAVEDFLKTFTNQVKELEYVINLLERLSDFINTQRLLLKLDDIVKMLCVNFQWFYYISFVSPFRHRSPNLHVLGRFVSKKRPHTSRLISLACRRELMVEYLKALNYI